MKLNTFENLFSSVGEKGRVEFFTLIFCNFILAVFLNLIYFPWLDSAEPRLGLILYPVMLLFAVAISLIQVWISVIAYIHRLHDIGLGGGWAFLTFIPIINFIFLLYLLLMKGQPSGYFKSKENFTKSKENFADEYNLRNFDYDYKGYKIYKSPKFYWHDKDYFLSAKDIEAHIEDLLLEGVS